MNTLEFLSQYLGSPIVAHRQRAIISLVKQSITNPKVILQLRQNLKSSNLDIVQNSLRVLLAIGYRKAELLYLVYNQLFNLGLRTNHFAILSLCNELLVLIDRKHEDLSQISKRLKPNLIVLKSNEYFFDNCNHSLEYLLGSKDYGYELAHICRAFRYDCKKAEKQVIKYMKELGYKKGSRYWKERPDWWGYDFEGKRYETSLQYFSRHSIQMFLLWCLKNLPIAKEDFEELLNYERNWDPAIPQLQVKEQPQMIKFPDMELEPNSWLKKKIVKSDAYNLIYNTNVVWFPLYESTNLKVEKKSFHKYITTCFIRTPIGKISRKNTTPTVNYNCHNCYINELPDIAEKEGLLAIQNDSMGSLTNKLIPSYGHTEDDFDSYSKLFPSPEIVRFFNLKQKKNTLEYYNGKEIVVQYINWQSGYHRNVGTGREDRYELSNYGKLLLIKTKYLRKYIQENKLKLFAKGSITKQLVDDYKSGFNSKDYKYKWLPFEIIKL